MFQVSSCTSWGSSPSFRRGTRVLRSPGILHRRENCRDSHVRVRSKDRDGPRSPANKKVDRWTDRRMVDWWIEWFCSPKVLESVRVRWIIAAAFTEHEEVQTPNQNTKHHTA